MMVKYFEIYRRLTVSDALEYEIAGAVRREVFLRARQQPKRLSRELVFRFPGAQYANKRLWALFPNLRDEIQDQFHRYLLPPTVVVKRRQHPFEPQDRMWDIVTYSLVLQFVRQPRYQGLNPALNELVQRTLNEPYRRASVFWEPKSRGLRFVLEPVKETHTPRKALVFHLFRDFQIKALGKPTVIDWSSNHFGTAWT
jgi:hypothetical protein